MAIPLVVGDEGLLPAGRHRATIDEIEMYFVVDAPFSERRALVFQALKTWLALVEQLLPGARLWVDGGFVTHKPWNGPSDVDVMILCQADDVNRLSATQQIDLENLLTQPAGPGRARSQPMGGLVDAYLTFRGPSGNADYWMRQWSQVKGRDGSEIRSLTKGFLEVMM